MKAFRCLIVSLFCISVYACGDDSGSGDDPVRFDFSFVGQGFDEMHANQDLTWRLKERTNRKLIADGTLVVGEENIEIEAASQLSPDERYYFVFYIDQNDNGTCDTAPTDHMWRYNIDQVSDNISITDTHQMTFSEVCDEFSSDVLDDSLETLSVFGSLELATGIDLDGVDGGGAVSGAQVFAAGYPSSETFTQVDGSFQLELPVADGQELIADDLKILMWYTEREVQENNFWTIAKKRVGASQDLTPGQTTYDLQSVDLNYTKGYQLRIEDEDSGSPVEMCWVRIPSLSFQNNVFYDSENEFYRIEYLPPGEYLVKVFCMEHEEKELTITIDEATDFDQWVGPTTLTTKKLGNSLTSAGTAHPHQH